MHTPPRLIHTLTPYSTRTPTLCTIYTLTPIFHTLMPNPILILYSKNILTPNYSYLHPTLSFSSHSSLLFPCPHLQTPHLTHSPIPYQRTPSYPAPTLTPCFTLTHTPLPPTSPHTPTPPLTQYLFPLTHSYSLC